MSLTKLQMPGDLKGDWSIEWLVEDHAHVERGDPIAVAQHKGERFLTFSPLAGSLRIAIETGFRISGKSVTLAQLLMDSLVSKELEVGAPNMSDERQVYLEKLKVIVKDAVKDDFTEVKKDFAAVNGRIDSLEKSMGARFTSVDGKLTSIDSTLAEIKSRLPKK